MFLQHGSNHLLLIGVEIFSMSHSQLLLHLEQTFGAVNIDKQIDHLFLIKHNIRAVDAGSNDRQGEYSQNKVQKLTHAKLFLVFRILGFIGFLKASKILAEEEN